MIRKKNTPRDNPDAFIHHDGSGADTEHANARRAADSNFANDSDERARNRRQRSGTGKGR